MKIPVFHLTRLQQKYSHATAKELEKVHMSGTYLFGPKLNAFESMLANFLNVPRSRVVACHSGTDALVLSMLAAGIKYGDEVITVANGAIPTASAIVQVGAIPVFCDVCPKTWLLDIANCLKLISPETKAILPVHLYGNVVDIPLLKSALAQIDRGDIKVIEDSAQCFGGKLGSRSVGTMGDFGAFSFYPTKNLGALGDAGAVVAQTEEAAKELRALAFYGQEIKNQALLPRGINSRLDEFQASILSVRIGDIAENLSERERLMKIYKQKLAKMPVAFPEFGNDIVPAWHLAILRVQNSSICEGLRMFLHEKGIQTLVHYPTPLHQQIAFSRETSKKKTPEIPVAERLASEIISLPFSHVHTELEINFVADSICDFFKSAQ